MLIPKLGGPLFFFLSSSPSSTQFLHTLSATILSSTLQSSSHESNGTSCHRFRPVVPSSVFVKVLMSEQARLQEVANLYHSTASSHGKYRAVSSSEWQQRAERNRIMWQCLDPSCPVPARPLHSAFRDRNGTLCNHSGSPELGTLAILAAHGTCWVPFVGPEGFLYHSEVSPETFTVLQTQQHVRFSCSMKHIHR